MPRLFAAVYPPPAWARGAIALAHRAGLPTTARIADADAVHLTVLFIGDAAERDMVSIRASIDSASAPITEFDLTPVRLVALPMRGPSRLLAVECDAHPAITELHRRLVARLARRPRDADRFLPHLTLARFSPAPFRPGPDAADAAALGPFRVAEVRLMRSTLHAGGAIHTLDHATPLCPR